jgi:protein-disulfide isomerase
VALAPEAPLYHVDIDGLPTRGDPSALVTIVAFTDYQCPYCGRADASLAQVRAELGPSVRLAFAELPLPSHDRARPAALAALAAAQQGAYETMRTRLFASPLDDAALRAAAADLGLDMARFDADLGGAATVALARSTALAEHLGVRGTPTFFVNGRRVAGAQPVEILRSVVTERLAAAQALVASGVRAEDVYARTVAAGLDHVDVAPADGGHCDEDCAGHDDGPSIGDAVENVPIDQANVRGPSSAHVTIVEFGDYQCPYCTRAQATLRTIERAHPGDVRVAFVDSPLPLHQDARPMALAALAAASQGMFWPMHDRLLAWTGSVDRTALDAAARGLGLDVARFDRDMDDPATAARLEAERAVATELGVKGTPTFFVNGHRMVGAQPAAAFERAIAR